jgi:hypothetical protein
VDVLIPELYALPRRFGPRPRSGARLPFRQLDQFPPAELLDELHRLCLDLPGVRSRQSRFAAPRSRALWLAESSLSGPPEAFIDGREFCHLHEPPDGSIHLTLPPREVEGVVARGWAERHPIHSLGVHHALLLVYSPRNALELEIVFSLIAHSWRFAGGLGRALPASACA